MRWVKVTVLFTMLMLTMLSSSLTMGLEAFSDLHIPSGFILEKQPSSGRLTIGNGAQVRSHLAETKLKQMAPSVHCGDEAMTLRVPGPRTPHFMVDRGNGSTVPLSEMPASCGFSVKRVRRDVSFVAPYRGCNVKRKGGSYVLPLIILGTPVQMSCPETPPLPKVSCFPSGMVISLGVKADTVQIKVDGTWQPLLLTYSQCGFTLDTTGGALVVTAPFTGSCWEFKDGDWHLPIMYGYRELTLSCPSPTSAPTTTAVAPVTVQDPVGTPQSPFYPFPMGKHWWHYPYFHPQPVPTTPPTTTAATTAPYDPVTWQPIFPQYPMPMFDPHHFHHSHHGTPHQPGWHPMFPFKFIPAATTPEPTGMAAPVLFPGYPQMYQMPQIYDPMPPVKYPLVPQFSQYPFYLRSPRSVRHRDEAHV